MVMVAHIKHMACAVTSFVFSLFYLLVLFFLALFKNVVAPSTSADRSNSLSTNEKHLVFDLEYYASLQGFDLEHYDVPTEDGYILQVHRLIAPGTDVEEKPRYPVLLLPGLMQSSSAYCTTGTDAIAFVLSRLGYDVWLGNNRGEFSPKHQTLSSMSAKFWDWSMHELATQDVPAMVEFVKSRTKASHVALVAHSQGTTQTFIALSLERHGGVPNTGASVSSFSALAPAVYAGPLVDRWFLRMLRVNKHLYHTLFGYHSFIPLMGAMRHILPLRFFTYVGYIVFNYMLGWDDKFWDKRYRSRNFIFAPVYVSSKLMFWWLGSQGFAHRKCIFLDENTNWFDERFPALQIHACGRDDLVLPEPLINHIYRYETDVQERLRINHLPNHSHLDVLWAVDAGAKVALPTARFIWENATNKEQWKTPLLEEV